MRVVLADGSRHEAPLEFYPTLRDATLAARRDWRLVGGGVGFHWARLDLDLSVAGILDGRRERVAGRGAAFGRGVRAKPGWKGPRAGGARAGAAEQPSRTSRKR